MATFEAKYDSLPDMPEKCVCFACEGHAVAYWSGVDGYLFVCRRCAAEVLPAFMADAIFLRDNCESLDAENALHRVEKAYWKAIASRLAMKIRRVKERHDDV